MDDIESAANLIEPVLTDLAKAILASRPLDIDKFCFEFFASRIGYDPTALNRSCDTNGSAHQSIHLDEDLDDDDVTFAADAATAIVRAKSCKIIRTRKNYDSTDDENDLCDDESSPTGIVPISVRVGSNDMDDEYRGAIGKVTSMYFGPKSDCSDTNEQDSGIDGEETTGPAFGAAVPNGSNETKDSSPPSSKGADYLGRIATSLEDMEFAHLTVNRSPSQQREFEYQLEMSLSDPRMKHLFDQWDADGSGDVDLVELVLALHKFNHVMEDGSHLKRASDALVLSDDLESSNQVLNYKEFAQLIVQFCDETYSKPFSAMADYMLDVAKSTSERAAQAAAEGKDVSQIQADDEEERELLKETVTGLKDSVVDNVKKIKTRRVMFM